MGADRPAIVMVHGGQWRYGKNGFFDPEANKLAELGWVAFDIGFRTDPPNPWPDELHDVQAAVRWVWEHADSLGVDGDRIAMLGASSGGHLAAMVGTVGMAPDPGKLRAPDPSGPRVVAVVGYSPPVDLNDVANQGGGSRSDTLPAQVIERFLGCPKTECPERYDAASPIKHVGPETAPMFLVNSTNEAIPLDQVQEMADLLDRNGVENKLTVLQGTTHALTADCEQRPCTRGYVDLVWESTISWLRVQFAEPSPPSQTSRPTSSARPHGPASHKPASRKPVADQPQTDQAADPESTDSRSRLPQWWALGLVGASLAIGSAAVATYLRRRRRTMG